MRKPKLLKNDPTGDESSPDAPFTPSHGPADASGHDSAAISKNNSTVQRDILCIIGLGNPGREYRKTRHNVGFWLIDVLASRFRLRLRRPWFAPYEIAELPASLVFEHERDGKLSGQAGSPVDSPRFSCILLVKPLTYMNRSGKIIPHLLRRYGHNLQFAAAVDQLDLPPGSVRFKKRGGTAGHNGLKSLVSYLDRDFWPLYIGIGRPDSKDQVISHVLGEAHKTEREVLDASISRLSDHLLLLLSRDVESVIQDLHSPAGEPVESQG